MIFSPSRKLSPGIPSREKFALWIHDFQKLSSGFPDPWLGLQISSILRRGVRTKIRDAEIKIPVFQVRTLRRIFAVCGEVIFDALQISEKKPTRRKTHRRNFSVLTRCCCNYNGV